MAKRWIKLHRTITGWEFFNSPGMLDLWVRLLLMADEDGVVITAETQLAKECGISRWKLRRMLDALVSHKQINKLSHKSPHKFATKITICNYGIYQASTISSRTSNCTSSSTSNRTCSAHVEQSIPIYSFLNEKSKHNSISFTDVQDIEREQEKRNKEKPPKGGKKKKENNSDSAAPLVRSEEFEKFEDWIERHAPAVAKMEKPFTEDQYREISKNWDARDVRDVLEAMGNTKRLLKDYVSAYATCKNWLKRRQDNNNKKNHRNSNLFVNDEWDEQ